MSHHHYRLSGAVRKEIVLRGKGSATRRIPAGHGCTITVDLRDKGDDSLAVVEVKSPQWGVIARQPYRGSFAPLLAFGMVVLSYDVTQAQEL